MPVVAGTVEGECTLRTMVAVVARMGNGRLFLAVELAEEVVHPTPLHLGFGGPASVISEPHQGGC